ncbi:uncharacterized protein BDW43DRAFT_316150 [Aspergillus alliaceus]|uniref:uncharacterized protein n=1 Tax=Petromyces alliaceus TaxID=209559 RepID=UPI0012A6C5E3|nr:uncharacterized protein BDW43DRAFT_316150 [Aspergillus alliaceus]KAB8228172.1 hypothetical protein BDW43DRAFT_316150 [Aspergillus alliaceus]
MTRTSPLASSCPVQQRRPRSNGHQAPAGTRADSSAPANAQAQNHLWWIHTRPHPAGCSPGSCTQPSRRCKPSPLLPSARKTPIREADTVPSQTADKDTNISLIPAGTFDVCEIRRSPPGESSRSRTTRGRGLRSEKVIQLAPNGIQCARHATELVECPGNLET